MSKVTSIRIDFPEPVDLPDGAAQDIVEIAARLCKIYQKSHPGRVMWPAGIGSLPTFIPMTREEEQERGMEFDESVFSVSCCEREDYKARCTKCGMEQGDHAHCIIDPPAGDCEFTIANG